MRQLKIVKSITDRKDATLDIYIKEITKENLLTTEQEIILAERIKTGDQIALNKLVTSNLRFVISVAKQYQNQGIDLLDLISEGNFGLIQAAKSFDETRGFRFVSYAVYFIRQSIMNAFSDHSRIVRLPINQLGTLAKVKKASVELEQILERNPLPDEIAAYTNIPLFDVELILSVSNKYNSLDEPINGDNDEENIVTLGSTLDNDNDNDTDENLSKESLFIELRLAVNTLTPKEKLVIEMFYGIDTPIHSLREISDKINLTKERVRQIKEKSVRKLRNDSRSKNLREFL